MQGWIVGEGGTIIHTTDGGGVVNIENEDSELAIPDKYLLSQNYPNPFNPSTTIIYSVQKTGFVSLVVYDILGNEVANLVEGELPSGKHSRIFDGNNLSSGVYFYTIEAGDYTQTKKCLLLK